MKNFKHYIYVSALSMLLFACEQEVKIPEGDPCPSTDPTVLCPSAPVEDCPAGASKGSIDVTKFVAVGNSFVAGVQGGALFTTGQNSSLPAIINKQLECVGAPAIFNQPTIGASLGWNLFVTQPFLTDNTKPILGRMLLQYGGAAGPTPTPQAYPPGNLEALPNPAANPGFIYGNGSTKAALNNFGIPAIVLGQSLISQTGAWAGAGVDPRFSPFYGRLAYPGTGTSTIIGDAAAAGGSFFLFWLGLDDFFLYAAFGADPSKAPLTPPSGGLPSGFDGQYGAAVGSLLASNANLKGVVGNFPDIFLMPHFTSVPWNAIVFTDADAAKVTQINTAYATYNGGLDVAFTNMLITAEERDKRKISFKVGANGIVIEDESLTNLSGLGLPSYRHATAADIFPLTAGSVIGKEDTPGNPATVWGVTKPLIDQYAIVPAEKTEINNARTAYNAVVAGLVAAYPTRLALADVNKALGDFVAAKAYVINGVTITPNINPPTGIYSEDGVHPNTRGYAFLSNVFIGSINTTFGASIPPANLGKYGATGLPIP